MQNNQAQLQEIDAMIDDGDLSRGAFTRAASDRFVLSVE